VALFVARLVCALVRRFCGDVVDLRRYVIFEIVHIVDAAARALLDGSARLVILLVAFLVAEPPRWSRGTEVRAPIAAARG